MIKMTKTLFFSIFLALLYCCSQDKDKSNQPIDVSSLKFDTGTKVVKSEKGYYIIDNNAVLPQYDSSLMKEYAQLRKFLESNTTFKLRTEWENGNDSPSDALWVDYADNSPAGFYSINTTEGHLHIYGTTKSSFQQAFRTLKKLFSPEFNKGTKKDRWYLPLIIIEHYK